MVDLNLVLPALNLSTLNFDNDAKSKIDDVLTEHGRLLHVHGMGCYLDIDNICP